MRLRRSTVATPASPWRPTAGSTERRLPRHGRRAAKPSGGGFGTVADPQHVLASRPLGTENAARAPPALWGRLATLPQRGNNANPSLKWTSGGPREGVF